MTPPLNFKQQLEANIREAIKELRRDGIKSMSIENLMQCTATPAVLDGAPRGTNARWMYGIMFEEVCHETPDIKPFVF